MSSLIEPVALFVSDPSVASKADELWPCMQRTKSCKWREVFWWSAPRNVSAMQWWQPTGRFALCYVHHLQVKCEKLSACFEFFVYHNCFAFEVLSSSQRVILLFSTCFFVPQIQELLDSFPISAREANATAVMVRLLLEKAWGEFFMETRLWSAFWSSFDNLLRTRWYSVLFHGFKYLIKFLHHLKQFEALIARWYITNLF